VVANLLALALGIAFVQIPVIEKALLHLAVASYCLPLVAIGPILTFVLHGDAPKAALAGLIVFFPSLVGIVVGLRSADAHTLDLIRAVGGGSWVQLFKVRFRFALPSTFAALKIAAPAAILGAIVGEYLGNQDHGLGIMMINSQATLEIPRTWGVALLCTAIAGICYVVIGLVGRAVSPWASPGAGG
jgi:ABC-type nitrate/sulfonate/bicarbonate transport system permease component